MSATRPDLRLYRPTSTSPAVPGETSDLLLARFASRVANWLDKEGLLTEPPYVDEFDDEPDYSDNRPEFTIETLAILDTPGVNRPSAYRTFRTDAHNIYLTRNDRVFCDPKMQGRIAIEFGRQIAGADDYRALKIALRVLVEVAKYPAFRTTAKLERSGKQVPAVKIDPEVRMKTSRLLDPQIQMIKKALNDRNQVAETIDAMLFPYLDDELEDLMRDFDRTVSDALALARMASRGTERTLGVIEPNGPNVRHLGRDL